MNVALSVRIAGLLSIVAVCGLGAGPRPLFGHADNCPLNHCQLAPLPAFDWPCDPPSPQVTLKVRVPAFAAPGRELEYRYFIENCSPADAHHVLVKNPLPANVRFVRALPQPHQLEPELQWRLGTIKGFGKCEISLIVVPIGFDDVRNCVRIQYEHGLCVTTRLAQAPPGVFPFPPVGDRPPRVVPKSDQTAEPKVEVVPPEGVAHLELTIEGPKDRHVNLAAKYFITVTNTGKAAATNLLVRATLPEKTDFVEASHDGHHLAGQIAWLLKDLEPGGKRLVELTYKSQGAGVRCVRASALADRGVATAQREFCTTFAGISALLLEMFDREDPVIVGGDTSFPIVVENTGSVPVTNLVIRARIPAQMVLAKAVPPDPKLDDRVPQGQWYRFAPMGTLAPGAKAEFEVFVKGVTVGDARFRVEMSADQLDANRGPVFEEESTMVYDEESGKIAGRMTSRKKR